MGIRRGIGLGLALALCGGGGRNVEGAAEDASMAGEAAADAGIDAPGFPTGPDAGDDADDDADAGPVDCTYDDGGAELDAASGFHGSCDGGCPSGTVCAVEIGGVAGGGGEYCAPIVDRCKNDVTCACLARCVCGVSFNRPEHCSDTQQKGTVLECDNGIR